MSRDVHPKVASASAASAASLVAEYFLHLPAAIAAAIVVLVTFAAGYLAPATRGG